MRNSQISGTASPWWEIGEIEETERIVVTMFKKMFVSLAVATAAVGAISTGARANGCQATSLSWTEITTNCGVYNMRVFGLAETVDSDAGLKVRMDGPYNGVSARGVKSNGTTVAACFASDTTFDAKFATAISDTCNQCVKYQYTAVN